MIPQEIIQKTRELGELIKKHGLEHCFIITNTDEMVEDNPDDENILFDTNINVGTMALSLCALYDENIMHKLAVQTSLVTHLNIEIEDIRAVTAQA